MEHKESLRLAGGAHDELRVPLASLQRAGARVSAPCLYTSVGKNGPTKRVKRPERVGKPFIGRALAFGIISGFYFRALRGVLGAFSSLQVAQD